MDFNTTLLPDIVGESEEIMYVSSLRIKFPEGQ